ncbi:hypothetical protein IBTHAUMO2_320040 [Nitrosopumilaceae archaeon]|nr:hypothetical protein [Nitrosopumilus sp.]CAI9831614.1 hypothetical protein IBTHAUMO2_320040 [Nitrosopumilaceae archaeon]MDA7945030.1 hypothetical protein [Nitrosopumilus sp.]MDA7954390.1 hypothetical protein [Nitrosopumilus sp.]MDA7974216.1 hypothetical protein [Nitrosopumilus sp.]
MAVLGHRICITGGVLDELGRKYDGACISVKKMAEAGTITVVKVPSRYCGRRMIYKDAEDELIAVATCSEAGMRDHYRLVTNDKAARKRCDRKQIPSLGILGFLVWCRKNGLLSHDDLAGGYDRMVEDGTVFKTTRDRFLAGIVD